MTALSNRVHMFARPGVKESLVRCFSTALGCGAPVTLEVPGLAEPILAWNFPNGGSLSVEFTPDALDEEQARRGAWLEIKTEDPDAVKERIREAGLATVTYLGNEYFVLPGGQVIRVV